MWRYCVVLTLLLASCGGTQAPINSYPVGQWDVHTPLTPYTWEVTRVGEQFTVDSYAGESELEDLKLRFMGEAFTIVSPENGSLMATGSMHEGQMYGDIYVYYRTGDLAFKVPFYASYKGAY